MKPKLALRLQLHAYNVLMRLATPLLLRKLRRRALAEPLYGMHIHERLGHFTSPSSQQIYDTGANVPISSPLIWIHAVSLGETHVAKILIDALRQQLHSVRFLLTHGTATGRAAGAALLQAGDLQVWQPWDTVQATTQFLTHFRPQVGLILETEVWPNLVLQSHSQQIPLLLANARLSEKSLQQTQRFESLARHVYSHFAQILPQSTTDAKRYRALDLSLPVLSPIGNMKFDAKLDADQLQLGLQWRRRAASPIVLLASSREGEEALWLQHQLPVTIEPDTSTEAAKPIWLIVPRHPQRFEAVAHLINDHGYKAHRRSDFSTVNAWLEAGQYAREQHQPVVLLGDSVGDMALYYGMSQLALLGGSFEPLGGQNLIEAAAASCPIITGASTFNFTQAVQWAIEAQAAVQTTSMSQAIDTVQHWLSDSSLLEHRQRAALKFSQAHQGAARKTALIVAQLLQSSTL